jgi:membrane protease YdiL (CAAX protease family)
LTVGLHKNLACIRRFSLWKTASRSTKIDSVSDLPVQILQTTFLSAIGLFTITAVFRSLKNGPTPAEGTPLDLPAPDSGEPPSSELPPPLPLGSADFSPYLTPAAGPPALAPVIATVSGIATRHFRKIDLLWLGFIFLVFSYLSVAGAKAPDQPERQIHAADLVTSIGFQFFLAGSTIMVMIWRVRPATWLGLRWSKWPWVFLIAPTAVLAMWALMIGLQVGGYMKWMESLGGETVQDTVKLLQSCNDPVILGLMSFAAVFVAPVCEEIIFRGFFYAAAKKFAGPWVAAVCSALVFAAAHGNLSALLPLFILALVLVFLYEKTGSLWAPIAVHFCFNGATVLIQFIARAYHLPLDPGT